MEVGVHSEMHGLPLRPEKEKLLQTWGPALAGALVQAGRIATCATLQDPNPSWGRLALLVVRGVYAHRELNTQRTPCPPERKNR